MIATALALLTIGAGVGIHVERAQAIPPEQTLALAKTFRGLVYAWTGETRVLVDEARWSECARADRCLSEIESRLHVGEVLMLQIEAGPARIRVIADLLGSTSDPRPTTAVVADLPRAETSWSSALQPLIQNLFPRKSGAAAAAGKALPAPALAAEVPRAEEPKFQPWPWLAIGTGAVLAGAGVVVAIGGASAHDRLNSGALAPTEASELDGAMSGRAAAANVLLGTAIVAVATGVALLVFD